MTSNTRSPSSADGVVDVLLTQPARAAEALATALADGAFSTNSEGHLLVPAGAVTTLAGAFPRWYVRGFRSIRAKPANAGAGRATTATVFDALRALEVPFASPHWAAGGYDVTLDRCDAVDLRTYARAAGDRAARTAAREVGLRMLDRFAASHAEIADRVRAAGVPTPPWFPVASRWTQARAELARLVDGPSLAGLPATIDDAAGPSVFFCDPKPANVLVTEAASLADPVCVDLDLVRYRSSYQLQAVLAVLSDPLPADGGEFAAARSAAVAACVRKGVDAAHVDEIIVYHVVRNFTTAATTGNHVKAEAFGRLLCLATGELGVADLEWPALARAAVPSR